MNKSILIFILILPCIGSTYAQSDIGFLVSTDYSNHHRVSLELRNQVKEKWKWNIGFTGGGYNRNFIPARRFSDSVLTVRTYSTTQSTISLRNGFEYRGKSSRFSVGGDFTIGYRKFDQSKSNSYYSDLSIGSVDFGEPTTGRFTINDPDNAQRTTHYLNTALQFSSKLDALVTDQFLMTLFFTYSYDLAFKLNESNQRNPLNDLQSSENRIGGLSINAGVGIRYRVRKAKATN